MEPIKLTEEQITSAVQELLQPYPAILTKKHIMEILNITRPTLIKMLDNNELPVMGDKAKWSHTKIHKTVFKQYLMEQYRQQ